MASSFPSSAGSPQRNKDAAGSGPRRTVLLTLGTFLCALLIATALSLLPGTLGSAEQAGSGRVRAIDTPSTMDSRSADLVARRVSAAHANVTAIWRHDFRWRFGRTYAPPEVIHFTGHRPSPCADGANVSGLSYCPLDRTISLDLAFLSNLAERLGGEGGGALILLVARVSAQHVQAELAILGDAGRARHGLGSDAATALDRDLALQGDCLTGVWARRAARHIGDVAPGAWLRIISAARDSSPEAAHTAGLDHGEPVAREEAFSRGYSEGELRDCLSAGLTGVLG